MANKDDYVSFEKVLAELELEESELRRMVSEGEIRAFREGSSMKFRREDVTALSGRKAAENELVFADALEDDTGMVTEELSDEDTLLAEDDVEPTVATTRVSRTRSTRAPTPAVEEEAHQPGWVTVAAAVSLVICIYGLLVAYSVAVDAPPAGLTGMFGN